MVPIRFMNTQLREEGQQHRQQGYYDLCFWFRDLDPVILTWFSVMTTGVNSVTKVGANGLEDFLR